MEIATFAGGCFWCTEALFKNLRGVKSVTPGYSGGESDNPTYEEVSTGETGHAESIQIEFDPKVISFKDLLYVFFKTHDPTTLNRQGADVGTQYRSIVFYHDERQEKIAQEIKKEIAKDYDSPIVTEILPFKEFYKAEDYHKNYYEEHKNAPYCKLVIDPKISKLKKNFPNFLVHG